MILQLLSLMKSTNSIPVFYVDNHNHNNYNHTSCGLSPNSPCPSITLVLEQIESHPSLYNKSGHVYIASSHQVYDERNFEAKLFPFEEIILEGGWNYDENNNYNNYNNYNNKASQPETIIENFITLLARQMTAKKIHFVNWSKSNNRDIPEIAYFHECKFENITLRSIVSYQISSFEKCQFVNSSRFLVPANTSILDSNFTQSSIEFIGDLNPTISSFQVSHSRFYASRIDIPVVNTRSIFSGVVNECLFEQSDWSLTNLHELNVSQTQLKHSIIMSSFTDMIRVDDCSMTEQSSIQIQSGKLINFSNSKFYNSMLSVTSSMAVQIRTCSFYNNTENVSVKIRDSGVSVDYCHFQNNQKGAIWLNNENVWNFPLSILASKFVNNRRNMKDDDGTPRSSMDDDRPYGGGALFLSHSSLSLFDCDFIGNQAINGGAIMAEHFNYLEISYSTFTNNTAMENGGAIYYLQRNAAIHGNDSHNSLFSHRTVADDLDFYLSSCSFFNNHAHVKGGALYLSQHEQYGEYISTSLDFSCMNNSANYAGGCLFVENMMGAIDQTKSKFEGNSALSYGSLTAGPLRNISFEISIVESYKEMTPTRRIFKNPEIPQLRLYPGYKIPFVNVSIWNEGVEKLKHAEKRISIQKFEQENGVTFFQNSELHEFTIRDFNVLALNDTKQIVKALLYIDETASIEMNILIEECPIGMMLYTFTSFGGICVELPKPNLGLIIPLALLGLVLTCFILIMLVYGMKCIIHRLHRLYKKEASERAFERVLNYSKVELWNEDQDTFNETTNLLQSVKPISSLSQKYVIPIEEIQVGKRIAEGSNGSVYIANWHGTTVALKTLKEEQEMDDKDFEREAVLLSSLRHPNIVNFLGVCMSALNKKHLIQEYLPRGSLEKLIFECRKGIQFVTVKQKIEILLGIARGMAYLHGIKPKPVIHRDLKPANILLDHWLNSKVCDFGLSRIKGTATSATTQVGTFFYMANEMIEGKSYNEKVDVFSFGIIMWELFFEESPYNNFNSDKLYKVKREEEENSAGCGLSVVFQVAKGLRPVIPFSTIQEQKEWTTEFVLGRKDRVQQGATLETLIQVENEYFQVMKECWDATPENRPSFLTIIERLNQCLKLFE